MCQWLYSQNVWGTVETLLVKFADTHTSYIVAIIPFLIQFMLMKLETMRLYVTLYKI